MDACTLHSAKEKLPTVPTFDSENRRERFYLSVAQFVTVKLNCGLCVSGRVFGNSRLRVVKCGERFVAGGHNASYRMLIKFCNENKVGGRKVSLVLVFTL